jgi:hypothetical protein
MDNRPADGRKLPATGTGVRHDRSGCIVLGMICLPSSLCSNPMRRILPLLALAALLAAPAARAQDIALSLTYASSVRSGAAAFGENARAAALRVEVPFGHVVPFGSLAVASEMRQPICIHDCGRDGTPYLVTAGVDYRLRDARPWVLVPYVGVGPELLVWSGGGTQLMAHGHVGGDLFLNNDAAFRLELQTAGAHTAVSAGLRLSM